MKRINTIDINTVEYWNKSYTKDKKNHGHKPTWDIIENMISDCKTVLDFGCGLGYLVERINKNRKNLNAYGCDHSAVAINTARERTNNIKNYFVNMPSDFQVDAVICSEVMEHMEQPELLMRKLELIAKKKIIITVPNWEKEVSGSEHIWKFEQGDIQKFSSFNCFDEKFTVGWGGPTRIIGFEDPKPQVILTSYCRPKYLMPTIESLLKDDIELIITDGGSDKDTTNFIKKYANKYLLFKDNPGADYLKTEGIKLITNKQFILTSDDLIYTKDYSKKIMKNYRQININGHKWDFCACSQPHYLIHHKDHYIDTNGVSIFRVKDCQVAGAIINTELCKSVGYFPIYGQSGQGDWAYSKRMRDLNFNMGYWKNVIVDHIGINKYTDYPEYTKNFEDDLQKYQKSAKEDIKKVNK